MSQTFDLIIIGAGPGGYTAAIAAAQRGMKTALVEGDRLGGTCLNRGCIPAKALLHSSGLYREMTEAKNLGVFAEGLRYEMPVISARKVEVVSTIREGIESLVSANKIAYFSGRAIISHDKLVSVQTAEGEIVLSADKLLIATGAVPSVPPIPGLELPGVVSSNTLLEGETPDYKSLVIIGGGVIGMEFASFYSELGCQVTVIEAAPRILPSLDREFSQNLTMILKKQGVEIRTGCTVQSVTETPEGLSCLFSGRSGEETVIAQGVLVSVGRRAKEENLFGEGLSPAFDRGLVVNDRFETTVPGIFAIGDVTAGSIQLAHAAAAEAINAVSLMVGEEAPIDLSTVPACVYVSPEIASVGLTAEEAKAQGIAVKTGKYAMSGNGKTIITDQDRSFMKLLFDAETEVLLGAQLMCARASDLIGELSTALVNGLTASQLSAVIRPHPTFLEGVTEAVEDLFGRAIHTLPKKR